MIKTISDSIVLQWQYFIIIKANYCCYYYHIMCNFFIDVIIFPAMFSPII